MNKATALKAARQLVDAQSISLIAEDSTTARQSLFGVGLRDGTALVMKCYKSAERLDAEIEGLRVAAEYAQISTPRIILTSRSQLVVFFEKIEGTNWTKMLTREPLATQHQIAKSIGEVLRRVHSVKPTKNCLLRVASLEQLLRTEFRRLERTYSRVKTVTARSVFDTHDSVRLVHQVLSRGPSVFSLSAQLPASESEFLEPCVLHGDLWSGNIFVTAEAGPVVTFLDYEFAMIGSPMIDLARVFSRGFLPRDPSRDYELHPNSLLWAHFAEGYKLSNTNIQDSALFHQSLIFSLVRTLNYYGDLIGEQPSADRLAKYLKTLRRISDATVKGLPI